MPDRIVGHVRIGDVALRPLHRDPHVDRSAPADLHHIAEPGAARRLPDQAVIGNVPLGFHPLEQAPGAEHGGPFLVAGDDEADRALLRGPEFRGRRDEGGNGALHVGGAAADELPVPDFGGEGIDRPLRSVSGRYDVRMPGKAEVRAARTDAREQIIDRAVRSFAPDMAPDLEAQSFQRRLEDVLRPLVGRGDARAAHEPRGKVDGIDGGRHCLPL